MEAHIAQLETSRAEYSLVLNYLLATNNGEFTVSKKEMKAMMTLQHGQLRVIKSTICDVTGDMTWTYGDEPPKEQTLIEL